MTRHLETHEMQERIGVDGIHEHHMIVTALEALDDRQLVEVFQAVRDLYSGTQDEAVSWVFKAVSYPIRAELDRRSQLVENARVALEANGHEVFLDFDEVAMRLDGGGWAAFCFCEELVTGQELTYEDAVRAGGEHAAERGGRWGEGEPVPADRYQ